MTVMCDMNDTIENKMKLCCETKIIEATKLMYMLLKNIMQEWNGLEIIGIML